MTTRTPTRSVTAIAIAINAAARAFAWDIPGSAPYSGPRHSRDGMKLPLLQSLSN